MEFISQLMGTVLRYCYNFTQNYGIAIILFTIIIKLALIPLNIKQQKSMKATQELQPLLLKIQEKYKNNPEKQQAELQRLYAEKKINPFGGCLLLFIQLPIILAMFYAIQKPITYMFPEYLQDPVVKEELANYQAVNETYKEVYYVNEKMPDLLETNFLGLNLAQVPSSNSGDWVMWIIPVLSVITTYLTSKISMKQTMQNNQNNQNEAAEQTMAMSKNMMMIMPLMTGYIAFIVPLGMGLYWLTNNIVSMVTQIFVNKYVYKQDNTKLLGA